MTHYSRKTRFLVILLVVLEYFAHLKCASSAAIFTMDISKDSERTNNEKLNYGQNPEELGTYMEGDIVTMPLNYGILSGIIAQKYRWPGAIVPYEIKGSFTAEGQAILTHAFAEYHNKTCVRFRPRIAKDRDYISIINDESGCWSSVGRIGGRQELNLQPSVCLQTNGTTIHELMHVLGFIHEHNRPERDSYIRVINQNVKPDMLMAFRKSTAKSVQSLGVGYDYGSVMHYSPNSFTKNGKPTIVALKKNWYSELMGQRRGLSEYDVKKINIMYRCKI